MVLGDKMEKVRISVVFDYIIFLGVFCVKKWIFLEVISFFVLVFGIVWFDVIKMG